MQRPRESLATIVCSIDPHINGVNTNVNARHLPRTSAQKVLRSCEAIMAIKEADLRRIAMFAPLFSEPGNTTDQRLRRQILESSRVRFCRKGTPVFDEGEVGDFLFVVRSGSAKVVLYGEGGREIILVFVGALEMFGELAILDGAKRSATVVTLEDTEFYEIPRAVFLAAVEQNAAVARTLINHLVGSLRRSTEQLRTKCMYESDRQVLQRLYLSSHIEETRDGRLVLSGCPQIHQIAQMIGCSRENVGRRLADLEEAGYIKTRRKPNRKLIDVTVEKKAVNVYLKDVPRPRGPEADVTGGSIRGNR